MLIDCILHQGRKDTDGYGKIRINKKDKSAHRHAYELSYGPIPKGMIIMHICDNPPCVNPKHLQLGTHQMNAMDRHLKQRDCRGSKQHNSKITEKDVKYIRAMRGIKTQMELANELGIKQSQISAIQLKQWWKHID